MVGTALKGKRIVAPRIQIQAIIETEINITAANAYGGIGVAGPVTC